MIGDGIFIGVQAVNLVAGSLIVWFSKKYEGQVCPFPAKPMEGRGRRSNPGAGTVNRPGIFRERPASLRCDLPQAVPVR
jgi:hypothetical protein